MALTEEFFFSRIAFEPTTGCWLWTGSLSGDAGYAIICADNTKKVKASRWVLSYFKGINLTGLVVCHKCDTPSCVNPDHLFAGTVKDNIRDASAKGRMNGPREARKYFNCGRPVTPGSYRIQKSGATKSGFTRLCVHCVLGKQKRRRIRNRKLRRAKEGLGIQK